MFREYVSRRKDVDWDPKEGESEGNVTGGETSPAMIQSPPSAPYSPPPPQSSPYAPPAMLYPPAPKPRRTGRTLLIIGLIVVLVLAALGAGAVFVNASLNATYSPEKTVTDYLAAQKRGDSAFMAANANYLRGDGSYSQYFDLSEVAAMEAYPENTDISDVKIGTVTPIDSSATNVNVTMTWHGHSVSRAFTVHKDPARVHYNFYNSWRVDVPYTTIHFTLPNQPGTLSVDGLQIPPGATGDLQVIEGFHKVTMNSTDLYANSTADADGIAGFSAVTFASTISPTALAAAQDTVRKAFKACTKADNAREACLGHTYYAPVKAFTRYFFTLPGYGDVFYTRYVVTLTSDPTVNMKLTVEAIAGTVSTSGACRYTMTVDGSRKYNFKGTWSATLTMAGGSFSYDLNYDCMKAKA